MSMTESTELWQKCLASCSLSQNEENKWNRSQLNSREGFLLFHLQWLWHITFHPSQSALTRNISRASSTQTLGEVTVPWGGWCLALPFVCYQPFPRFIFFPPKFAEFHVGTRKVNLWNDNCPTHQIKTIVKGLPFNTKASQRKKLFIYLSWKHSQVWEAKSLFLTKKARDRNFKTQKTPIGPDISLMKRLGAF